MGGEVTCTSEIGQGTQFKIQLSSYCLVSASKTQFAKKENYIILEKSCVQKKIKVNYNLKQSTK